MTYEAWRISYQSSEQAARAAYEECAQLRARIDEMEKQGPVAWMHPSGGVLRTLGTGLERATHTIPLYLAPGAKGEEK